MEMEAYSESLGRAKHWPRTLADQFPGRWLLDLVRWIMAVKIDIQETVPPHAAMLLAPPTAPRSFLPRWPMTPGNLT